MKRLVLFLAAAVMVSTVVAGFKYEGEWGTAGSPNSIDLASNGNVYVGLYTEGEQPNVYYFTPTGSLLGSWKAPNTDHTGLAIGPGGNVYTGGCYSPNVNNFTKTGSLIGSWPIQPTPVYVWGGDLAPNGNVYVSGEAPAWQYWISYFTPGGSTLGSWRTDSPGQLSIAPNGNVYMATRYYTSSGSLLGSWAYPGGDLWGVDVGPKARVFVTHTDPHCVLYFTLTGSLLGSFGSYGSGPGQFRRPLAVAVTGDGKRVYVADFHNKRIQYFVDDTAVTPTSLGKVKALFK